MSSKIRGLLVTAVLFFCLFSSQVALGENSQVKSIRNEKEVLKYLSPILKSSKISTRIYYQASCSSTERFAPFPAIKLRRATNASSGVEAIREVFQIAENVKVSERSNIVRIIVGNPEVSFLQTRIARLKFSPAEKFNFALAISALQQTREVQAAARKMNLDQVRIPIDMLLSPPIESLPHLPDVIEDINFDDALDQMAVTFKGVLFYGVCSRHGLYELRFFSLTDADEGAKVRKN